MNFFGWTCPECDEYYAQVSGHRTENGVSIKCPVCGAVDRVGRESSGEVAT